MTQMNLDQEIRAKALEIAIYNDAILAAASIRAGTAFKGMAWTNVDSMEEYIRSGKKPR
jgi:hypothetical protein